MIRNLHRATGASYLTTTFFRQAGALAVEDAIVATYFTTAFFR
ncbi:hypothetical protein [Prevotella falsenii]|nr:hypothetical protein [Prevotella falsenii]